MGAPQIVKDNEIVESEEQVLSENHLLGFRH